MPIKTSTFGGVELSGQAADDFIEQFIRNSQPNPLAQKALDQGIVILKELGEKG